ncbi:hypothetical protein INR49_025261 [Caranx melampygus]|nr:hypothetical protein INR49_025261 [Caranx melampygus]
MEGLDLEEPSRPHGGPDGRGHGEESEPSDDEMLSLSSQRSNASTAPQKPEPPTPTPAPPAPAEEVDLLGLDGEDISRPCPTAQPPPTAAAATDLLGDLFGGPPQPASGPSSAQSTPHKVVPNTASPCPSPAPPAFDPFGTGPMPKPQDVMGSFLGPGNMGQPDPFLHAARSPSPTLQPTSLGRSSPVPPTTPTVNIQQQNAMGGWDWNRPATTSTGGGFGMGSRSATTSPTGSVHSTPTHQTKPNTLDPFADIGNLGEALEEVLAFLANPLPLQEQPLPFLPWAPHRGPLHLPSMQEDGSPTQVPASPHGSQVLEVLEDGNPRDRAQHHSQSPAPATPPCLTHRHRIDPTTTSASLQWEEAHPVQGAKHRLPWVRSPRLRMPTLMTCCRVRALQGPKRRKGPGL